MGHLDHPHAGDVLLQLLHVFDVQGLELQLHVGANILNWVFKSGEFPGPSRMLKNTPFALRNAIILLLVWHGPPS